MVQEVRPQPMNTANQQVLGSQPQQPMSPASPTAAPIPAQTVQQPMPQAVTPQSAPIPQSAQPNASSGAAPVAPVTPVAPVPLV